MLLVRAINLIHFKYLIAVFCLDRNLFHKYVGRWFNHPLSIYKFGFFISFSVLLFLCMTFSQKSATVNIDSTSHNYNSQLGWRSGLTYHMTLSRRAGLRFVSNFPSFVLRWWCAPLFAQLVACYYTHGMNKGNDYLDF